MFFQLCPKHQSFLLDNFQLFLFNYDTATTTAKSMGFDLSPIQSCFFVVGGTINDVFTGMLLSWLPESKSGIISENTSVIITDWVAGVTSK